MPRERLLKKRERPQRAPGELYRQIVVQRELIEEERSELFVKKENWYVRFCKRLYSIAPSLGAGAEWPENYKDAMAFLNWDLKAEEFSAAIKIALVGSIMVSLLAALLILGIPILNGPVYGMFKEMAPLVVIVPFISIALLAWWYMQRYPFSVVLSEQRQALGYVPELIGYIVMSMKLSPNLEKAAEFAADHGRGKIAQDFKKLLWNVELGVYNTLSEGLDDIAYTWGQYSKEFKRALMRVRASVLEDSESKRDFILNKTMEDLLSEIREKMENYARELQQPSTVLFYIGVLLPIILIIILPIGSAFTNAPLSTPVGLIGIYNIGIPVIAFLYARSIIKHRPPTYDVPVIPDDYPGLPKPGKIKLKRGEIDIIVVVGIILVFGGAFTLMMHTEGFPPKTLMKAISPAGSELSPLLPPDTIECDRIKEYYGALTSCLYFDGTKNAPKDGAFAQIQQMYPNAGQAKWLQELEIEKARFFTTQGNDVTPYNTIFGIMLTAALCFFVWFYYHNIYKRRMQEKIMTIESEFKDSLYIIASRLGENKPLEEAMRHAREFLPNYVISDRIFGRALDNINLLGMPIDSAIFDPRFGALVNIPSNTVHVGMRLMIDAVQLGVNIAARTLVSLSLQLDNQEKVQKMLKNMVIDLTQMMRTMAIIITPLVLGITTALYTVVLRTLLKISTSDTMSGLEGSTEAASSMGSFGGMTSGSFAKPEAVASMVKPEFFIIIIALYVVEIVFIVIYFTTKIEEDNDLLMKLYLAKYLPAALLMFAISVTASNLLLNSFSVVGG
ncbi:MAG: hypothetical protein NT067_06445 [Candidatus Diapherotrites archaeon]|nr:hypothetical protein [Candidatus Diapherotrites archaeon]